MNGDWGFVDGTHVGAKTSAPPGRCADSARFTPLRGSVSVSPVTRMGSRVSGRAPPPWLHLRPSDGVCLALLAASAGCMNGLGH